MDGTEATLKLKQSHETMHIPIVILTARHMSDDAKRALESGAVEILQKPVTIQKIQEVLLKYTPRG